MTSSNSTPEGLIPPGISLRKAGLDELHARAIRGEISKLCALAELALVFEEQTQGEKPFVEMAPEHEQLLHTCWKLISDLAEQLGITFPVLSGSWWTGVAANVPANIRSDSGRHVISHEATT
jgi:hypothetical protein